MVHFSWLSVQFFTAHTRPVKSFPSLWRRRPEKFSLGIFRPLSAQVAPEGHRNRCCCSSSSSTNAGGNPVDVGLFSQETCKKSKVWCCICELPRMLPLPVKVYFPWQWRGGWKKNGNSNISINHLPREEVLLRNEKLFLILVRIHRGNARTGTELANELSRHSKRRRFYGNNFSKCIHVEASRKISSQLGAQTTAIDFLEWHIIRFYLSRHLGKHTFWLNLP